MISGYLYRSGRQNIPKKNEFPREWRLAHVPFETGAIRATHRDF